MNDVLACQSTIALMSNDNMTALLLVKTQLVFIVLGLMQSTIRLTKLVAILTLSARKTMPN